MDEMIVSGAAAAAAPVETVASRPDLPSLYRTHRLSLVRLGVLLLGDQQAAEDAVQDVFMSLWRKRNSPDGPVSTLAYVRGAVVNRCRSDLRRRFLARRRRPLADLPGPAPGDELELAEEHRGLLAALRRLPTRQREVLVLRYYSELPVAEVAEVLGIHEGTVKSTSARGLAALRELLRESEAS